MHILALCVLLMFVQMATCISREPHNGEHGCSKFYYEHELLDKSVRLTLKAEELDNTVKQLQASLRTIMFSAKQLADTTLDTSQVMVFTEVVTNQGSGYDVTTGMFTAPAAGTYLFTAHLCVYYQKSVFYSIVVDGKELVNGFNYQHTGNHPCGTVTATVILQPPQRVWVKCTSTSQLFQDSSRWNVFTGVMVHGEV